MIEIGKFTGEMHEDYLYVQLNNKEICLVRPVMIPPMISTINQKWLDLYKDKWLVLINFIRDNRQYPVMVGLMQKEGSEFPTDDTRQHFLLTEKFRIWVNDTDNKVVVDVLDDGEILFGNKDVSEPLVLGNKFKSYLDDLVDAITQITVISPVGTTSTPTNIATFTQLKTKHTSLLSEKVKTK